jgi:parallel beta-helix repeat protein
VWVHSGQDNAILRNSIFENNGLGIKLGRAAIELADS